MASPSMPDPQCHSGAHNCDTDQVSHHACSIASSNETADDLPGAGRTLGKLYSIAGRFLERSLGRAAEKMGYGPRAMVVRIHRRRFITASKRVESKYCSDENNLEYWKGRIDQLNQLDQILKDDPSRLLDMSEEHYWLLREFSSGFTSSKEKDKMKKYCKRLIRYVRSNVESTKRQALDYIIELAIEDEYVRELLMGMGAVNVIESLQNNPTLWIHCGASLQNSSRKALIVLGDAEVLTLLRAEGCKDVAVRLQTLTNYLQDPIYSFVAVRYLRQLALHFRHILDQAVDGIVKAINANCDIVEFEECDRILEFWVQLNFGDSRIHKFSAVLETIFRYADKLPRTVDSKEFQEWLMNLESVNTRNQRCFHAHFILAVIRKGIAAANRSEDKYLQATYSYPGLQPLLHVFESPPDIALSLFAYEECDKSRVPGAKKLKRLCDKLITFASSINRQIRERTWHCAKVLLSTDIYCRTAVLKALSLSQMCYPTDSKFLFKRPRF